MYGSKYACMYVCMFAYVCIRVGIHNACMNPSIHKHPHNVCISHDLFIISLSVRPSIRPFIYLFIYLFCVSFIENGIYFIKRQSYDYC